MSIISSDTQKEEWNFAQEKLWWHVQIRGQTHVSNSNIIFCQQGNMYFKRFGLQAHKLFAKWFLDYNTDDYFKEQSYHLCM